MAARKNNKPIDCAPIFLRDPGEAATRELMALKDLWNQTSFPARLQFLRDLQRYIDVMDHR